MEITKEVIVETWHCDEVFISNEVCEDDEVISFNSNSQSSNCSQIVLKNDETLLEEEDNEYILSEEVFAVDGNVEEPHDNIHSVDNGSVAAFCDVVESKGDVVRGLKCPLCPKVFELKNSLSNHIKSHSDVRRYSCSQCGSKFKKAGDFQRHRSLCGQEHQNKCETCGKTFMNGNSLTNHMRAHSDEKPFSCEMCGLKFKKSGDMKNHVTVCRTGVLPYSCGQCGKQFAMANSLANHCLVHQGTQIMKTCRICGRGFRKPGSLAKHERICETGEVFSCTACEAKFTSNEQRNRHEKVHVNKKLQCDICLKTFTHANGFATHKKSHIELRFVCSKDECDQVFKTSLNLKKHLNSHVESKTLDCTICGRNFGGAWNLKRHLLTHEGLKPFQCPSCNKSFSCEKDMTAHSAVHTGKKGFSCTSCSSSFTHLRGLQQHMVIHSDKASVCGLGCGKRFLSDKLLIAHVERCKFNPAATKNVQLARKFGQDFKLALEKKGEDTPRQDDLVFRCKICDSKFGRFEEIQKHVAEHKDEKGKDEIVISIEMPENNVETKGVSEEDVDEEVNMYVIKFENEEGSYEIESHVKYLTIVK